MSLFDSASLCVTPNAYKEDKLYSIKPTDGSGDLVVTRATTATRVNSAGLVEVVPYNLLQYSQDLTNAAWSLIGTITRTSNYGTAPDGTQTSTRIQWGGGANFELYQYTGKSADVLGSIYIKGTLGQIVRFNNSNVTLTGSWQEVSNSLLVDGSNTYMSIRGIVGTTTALDFQVWGAQAVQGTSAKEYFPTTDRLNVPRIDYTNGSCPSILVEPQRTNLLTYSNTFTDASWNLEDATISANVAISPDGTQNASKLVSNANNTDHTIYKTVLTLVDRTFSCYVKADGYNYVFLGNNNGLASQGVFFNLTNGTISQNTSTFTASIQSAGNGWYRCTISQALWTIPYAMICLSNNGTSFTFAGNGTSGVLIYGAQNEAGSYATSYIPTVASSVTRNADVISKTGISSLIGQTEGTMFFDGYFNDVQSGTVFLDLEGTFPKVNFQIGSGILYFYSQGEFSFSTAISLNTRYKIAGAYKNNDVAFYVNGVQIGVDNSATITAKTNLYINSEAGSYVADLDINSIALWKTRLDNTTLATLTTI